MRDADTSTTRRFRSTPSTSSSRTTSSAASGSTRAPTAAPTRARTSARAPRGSEISPLTSTSGDRRGRQTHCRSIRLPGRPRIPARDLATAGQPELLEAVQRVLDAPGRGDAIALEREEVDLVHALEAAARGRMAAPFSEVGRRAGEPRHHGVPLRDQVEQLHVHVREGAAEGSEPLTYRPG